MAVFAIKTADDARASLTNGRGEVVFNVTNTSGRPLRGRGRIVPLGSAKADWLSIAGEVERNFSVNETHQFAVQLSVPPETAEGSYTFRLDVASVHNPDEDFAEGQTVAFEVPPAPVPNGPFPWWIVAVVAGVIVLIGGGVVLWLLLTTDKVTLPELAELSQFDETGARQRLEGLCDDPQPCLEVAPERESSTEVPQGFPITTKPEPGTEVEVGSQVTLVISSGPPTFSLPPVSNKSEEEARQLLENVCEPTPCFQVQTNTEPSDSVAKGLAVRTNPPADNAVAQGSRVDLILSGGPATIRFSDLSGSTENRARGDLQNLGLQVTVQHEGHDTLPNGIVIRTQPNAGTPVSPGSRVTLVVAKIITGGQQTLRAQETFNLDDGTLRGPSSMADLFFNPNAKLVNAGFKLSDPKKQRALFLSVQNSPIGYKKCFDLAAQRTAGFESFSMSQLRRGTHLCVITTERNVAQVRVLDLSPSQFRLEYKTWPGPGLPRFSIPVRFNPAGIATRPFERIN